MGGARRLFLLVVAWMVLFPDADARTYGIPQRNGEFPLDDAALFGEARTVIRRPMWYRGASNWLGFRRASQITRHRETSNDWTSGILRSSSWAQFRSGGNWESRSWSLGNCDEGR